MTKLFLFLAIIINLAISTTAFIHTDLPPHFQHPRFQQNFESQIDHFDQLLQGLSPHALDYFVRLYHSKHDQAVTPKLAQAKNGAYFFYVGKLYLYGFFQNPQQSELQQYKTQARYLAAYFYLKVAAERYGNRQAYYLLGLLEQFKLVPDKIIQGNLQKSSRNKHEQILYKYLKTSHLNNGQHMLYMSAALSYDPAALILAHMNRQPFGTTYNCTTSLAYYMAVLKRSLFQPYIPKLVFQVHDSLEDQLFSMRKLQAEQSDKKHDYIDQTTYFDEETISATLEQANRLYTGSGGVLRDLPRALHLYEKLSYQQNNDGKIMAGLMYFRGEGAPRNIHKSRVLFQQAAKDEIAQYMLLAMDYFEMFGKTKDKALLAMRQKSLKKNKLTHLMQFLIGSAALKGEIKEVSYDDAVQMIDRSAAEGNPSARVLMAILFTDGAKGLKYGCSEAVKYLNQDAHSFPYFRKQINTAQYAIKRGLYSFAFFKYMELSFNSYRSAFINLLYLIENYEYQALNFNQKSWLPSKFAASQAYKVLRRINKVPEVYDFLSNQYTILGATPLKIGQLQNLLKATESITKSGLKYMTRKIIKRGVLYESKGILKYYQYKLLVQQGSDQHTLQQILSTLASGDSNKLYVSEARYLLGQLYHKRFLRNRTSMPQKEQLKVLGQYNRAVKSQILGKMIFEIEQYRIKGELGFNFSQSQIGSNFLAYVFVLAIVIFVLYYLRSKRFDHFHKIELERQLKKTMEQQAQLLKNSQQNASAQEIKTEEIPEEMSKEEDSSQPIITEDHQQQRSSSPRGIRIGSSQQEEAI